MKKTIFIATLILSLTSMVYASSAGLKLGANFSSGTGDDIEDAEYTPGFVGGAFLDLEINHFFSIQPEFLFSMKGGAQEDSSALGKGRLELDISYLEIPLLAKFTLNTGGLNPFFMVGPYIAFELDSEARLKGESVIGINVDSTDHSPDVADIDFGLMLAGGAEYPVSQSGSLTGELRFSLGLLSVDDPDQGDPDDVRNIVFALIIGYSHTF